MGEPEYVITKTSNSKKVKPTPVTVAPTPALIADWRSKVRGPSNAPSMAGSSKHSSSHSGASVSALELELEISSESEVYYPARQTFKMSAASSLESTPSGELEDDRIECEAALHVPVKPAKRVTSNVRTSIIIRLHC